MSSQNTSSVKKLSLSEVFWKLIISLIKFNENNMN